jgi:replicative DNA helicase
MADNAGSAIGDSGARHVSKSLADALTAAETRQTLRQSGKTTGIPTGIASLDRLTGGGWQPGQLVILAARPAAGKSAVALSMAKAAAMNGTPVLFMSLEMGDVSLADRLLLSECDIDADDFRAGHLTPADWRKLDEAAAKLQGLPIHIDPSPMVSMRKIRSRAKTMHRRGKCSSLFIDYLQLIDCQSDKKGRNREQEVSEVSRQAKLLANELQIPVILLSQLNRAVESRADKTPLLSDLRESGAIEQDADIVAFIHRPAYYNVEQIPTRSYGTISAEGVGILTIAKQRNGAVGTVLFSHNESLTRVTDYRGGQTSTAPTEPDGEPF